MHVFVKQVFVLDDWPNALAEIRKFSTLHAINRAITAVAATGHKFPNVEFSLATQDTNSDHTRPNWAYDRLVTDNLTMMIPDFGFYSWTTHEIGTYREVRRRIKEVEDILTFDKKNPKLVWRGTVKFGAEIREALINASEGKSWSAVESLDWLAPDFRDHMLTMQDHCRYKFVAQTEG